MNTPDHDTLFRAVVDANPEAKARLKEIMNQYPDPEDELIEIWETWIATFARLLNARSLM